MQVEGVSSFDRLRSNKDGDIRLIDENDKTSGTVQIFRGYSWGSVCDDHWTMKEGNVVCRQLGMGYAVKIYRNNFFKSSNSLGYLLDDVHCNGNETRLVDCKHRGWSVHNCKRNEQVGVQCVDEIKARKTPEWNPLNLDMKKGDIESLSRGKFTVVRAVEPLNGRNETLYPVVIDIKGSSVGSVCSDFFSAAEAMVFCKSLNLGSTGRPVKIPMDPVNFPAQRHLLMIGRCYGNETSLNDCFYYTASMKDPSQQLPCSSDSAVGVECFPGGSDLLPSKYHMESSAYLQRIKLWHLECAIEERCLPESVNNVIEKDPYGYVWKSRLLLRFSSIIDNIGSGPFIPFEDMKNWEWHACHMHYHSMKVFAIYNLVDPESRIIANGHKASFCLEDSECNRGVTKKFQCSNVVHNYGTQGISPGCRDTYLHDYDCQWIDVTDVLPGTYTLEIMYNPEMLVAESDFFNNGFSCKAIITTVSAHVSNCVPLHPLDMT